MQDILITPVAAADEHVARLQGRGTPVVLVPLTSVRQPRHQLGRAAAQLLLEEALDGGNHQHRQVIFEPELVVRQSSRAIRLPVQAAATPDGAIAAEKGA